MRSNHSWLLRSVACFATTPKKIPNMYPATYLGAVFTRAKAAPATHGLLYGAARSCVGTMALGPTLMRKTLQYKPISPMARALHTTTCLRNAGNDDGVRTPSPDDVDVLYDGECPLCLHEITWLSRRNQKRGDIKMTFTDISLPTYDPSAHAGVLSLSLSLSLTSSLRVFIFRPCPCPCFCPRPCPRPRARARSLLLSL